MDRKRAWKLIFNKNSKYLSEGKIHFVTEWVAHTVLRHGFVKDVAWLSWEWGADLHGNQLWLAETHIETGDQGSSKSWALRHVNLQTAIY